MAWLNYDYPRHVRFERIVHLSGLHLQMKGVVAAAAEILSIHLPHLVEQPRRGIDGEVAQVIA